MYKSKAGTVIIIRSIFGYENDRERSLGNIAWILEDYIVIEDLVNKAKNKDSAVILISGTLDDPMFTSYIIENENLKKVLEKNDPEDYGYFISKFLQKYAERTDNPIHGNIGDVIHIVQ